jgi:hypothetical protein
MKRDMDLIRALLLDVEGETPQDLSKWSEETQVYHLALLIESNLVHGAASLDGKGVPTHAHATYLSWEGHEFIDAARNEGVWNQALTSIKSSVGSVSLSVIQQLLKIKALDLLGVEGA